MKKEYAAVTTISTFHHTYIVPLDQLQKLNPEQPVDESWLADCVTMDQVEEFSQEHLGEQIVNVFTLNEKEVLETFDDKNSYLSSWPTQQKIEWVRGLLDFENE